MTAGHKMLLTSETAYRYTDWYHVYEEQRTLHIILLKQALSNTYKRGRRFINFAIYINISKRNFCLLLEIQQRKTSYSNGNNFISFYLQLRRRLFDPPLYSDWNWAKSSSVSVINCDISLVIKRPEACRWPLTNIWRRKVKQTWTPSPPPHLSSWLCANLFMCTNSYKCL